MISIIPIASPTGPSQPHSSSTANRSRTICSYSLGSVYSATAAVAAQSSNGEERSPASTPALPITIAATRLTLPEVLRGILSPAIRTISNINSTSSISANALSGV